MKDTPQRFTSIVSLLVKAGHKPMLIKSEKPSGFLRGGKHYAWFAALQILVEVDNNDVLQIRQDGDGNWMYQKNRKNSWNIIIDKKFTDLIEPHYRKFLNDEMMGEDADVAESERRGLQSGDDPQAR